MGKKLGPGDKAPNFAISDDQAKPRSLKSYAGKKLVLYFYPKDDTSGCTKEALDFSRLKAQFDKAGIAILGVSPDTPAAHGKFKGKHDLAIDLGADPEKTMLEAYGVWTEKSLYGRQYMGVERTTFLIGPNGVITAVWNKVKVPGHAEAVLAAATGGAAPAAPPKTAPAAKAKPVAKAKPATKSPPAAKAKPATKAKPAAKPKPA